MQTEDILISFAELAVALAGFAGIVGALDRRKFKQWRIKRKLGFLTLLTTSLGALFNCIIAIILLNAEIRSHWVWSICGAFWIVTSLSINFIFWRRLLKAGLRVTIVPVAYTVALGAVVILQVYNILVLQSGWPFLVAIALLLGSSSAAFFQLVIGSPVQNGEDEF